MTYINGKPILFGAEYHEGGGVVSGENYVSRMSVIDEKRIKAYEEDGGYYFSENNWNKFIGENNRAYVELYKDRGQSGMYALRETEQPLYNAWYSKEAWAERFAKEHPGEEFREPMDKEYPTLDSIAQRSGEGHLNVPLTPVNPTHAVPLNYVAKLEKRLNALENEVYSGTEGLKYELSADGKYYICTGLGDVEEGSDIEIATYIDGIPVTEIASYAFERKALKAIRIPITINKLGERGFSGASVESVHIRDVGKWAEIAFGGIYASPMKASTSVYINGRKKDELVIPDSVFKINNRAFAYWTQFKSLILPRWCSGIGAMAFQYMTGLETVTIPNGVQYLEASSFGYCTALTEVTFEGWPVSISVSAFEGCTNLQNIYVPWNEGAVPGEGTKWGASNATIHYNSEV